MGALRGSFAALRHPNHRLWFAGPLLSMVGMWMQITAQGYLVFDLTHSSAFLGYVASHRSIRVIIALLAAITVLGFSCVSLLPTFAVKVLHGDAQVNGWLQSARGVGALIAALYIATRGRVRRSGRLLSVGSLLMPMALLVFAAMQPLPLALAALVVVGAGVILFYNSANALVQTLADDGLRGRVMSVYSLTFFGLMPFGSLAMGRIAAKVGEPITVGVGAALLFVCALAVQLAVPSLRRLE